jgi:pyruvate-formate lyase-activating enzyme
MKPFGHAVSRLLWRFSGASRPANARLLNGAALAASSRPWAPRSSSPNVSERGSFLSSESPDRTSCRYLESGLCFYSDRIAACGVTHHGTGIPTLAPYSGGPVPFSAIARGRAEIIRRNQISGHGACRGCPNLVRQEWPEPGGSLDWLGITHHNGCNNACDYCWRQWAEGDGPGVERPAASYVIIPAVVELIDGGRLAPDLTVDFGGGGEPTLMPEFDEAFGLFVRRGATIWLHTNAVCLPAPVIQRRLDLSKVHVVCSVDAGTPGTYRTVKQRDHFPRVWANLAAYREGGAEVVAKYLMQGNNCAAAEVAGFIRCALATGIHCLQWDIDMRFPDPTPDIISGLAYLHHLAEREGLSLTPGSIGLNSASRLEICAKVQAARRALAGEDDQDARTPGVAPGVIEQCG